jgi:hypothetical protein
MRQCLSKGDIDTVLSLRHTYRCADDILNLGCQSFATLLTKLWPVPLISLDNETLERTEGLDTGRKAHYLSATFWLDDQDRLTFAFYSKLVSLGIPHYAHEHIVSNMPPRMLHSLVTGTLVQILMASSSSELFLRAARSVLHKVHRVQHLQWRLIKRHFDDLMSKANKQWPLPFDCTQLKL